MAILMDGAVGTSLWEKSTDKKPVWMYNITNPAIVKELCEEYVAAGSQIILANTFAANRDNVKRENMTVEQVVSAGVKLCNEAVRGRAKIAMAVGPLSKLMEPYGDMEEEEAYDMFDEMICCGVANGVDMIYCQTFMDLAMMQQALKAAEKHALPILCSFSFDKRGKTMMGNSVEAVIEGLEDYRVDAIGLNCSLGPDLALPVIEEFSKKTDKPLIFKPNAGAPISGGAVGAEFDMETFAKETVKALDYGVTYIGGCCGSNPGYIRKLGELLKGR